MISTPKELEHLLKLCRKQGVSEFKWDNIEFKLGEMPQEMPRTETSDDPMQGFPQGTLTEEQLIFYSTGGVPANDPALKVG